MVEVAVGLIPALLVFQHLEVVNGWDVGLVVAVTGLFTIATAILASFVLPNQAQMTDYLRLGELARWLTRPTPPHGYCGSTGPIGVSC